VIVGLDMPPSATIGASGDYEVTGRIRYTGCNVVTRSVQLDHGGESRSAPEPADADGYEPLTIRFAASEQGHDEGYEVVVYDARGQESWPPLRQSVHLE
jgi:hypothetical protein